MKKPIEIIREYQELLESIPDKIKESGLKDKFIYEKIGISKTNFYRRLNKPELWDKKELIELFELIIR
jgi:hypothetical protein